MKSAFAVIITARCLKVCKEGKTQDSRMIQEFIFIYILIFAIIQHHKKDPLFHQLLHGQKCCRLQLLRETKREKERGGGG